MGLRGGKELPQEKVCHHREKQGLPSRWRLISKTLKKFRFKNFLMIRIITKANSYSINMLKNKTSTINHLKIWLSNKLLREPRKEVELEHMKSCLQLEALSCKIKFLLKLMPNHSSQEGEDAVLTINKMCFQVIPSEIFIT